VRAAWSRESPRPLHWPPVGTRNGRARDHGLPAHELNHPLGTIINLVNILSRRLADPVIRTKDISEHVQNIRAEAIRATSVIRNMRMLTEHKPPSHESLSLLEVCHDKRDRSATNVTADTAEAGLFQKSWNSRSASPELPKLFAAYSANPDGFLSIFREGLSGSASSNEGRGEGAAFQALCKSCPAFAVEAAAVGLRTIRRHWGPINRREAQIRPEAETLLLQVQKMIESAPVLVADGGPIPTVPRPHDPPPGLLGLTALETRSTGMPAASGPSTGAPPLPHSDLAGTK